MDKLPHISELELKTVRRQPFPDNLLRLREKQDCPYKLFNIN